MKEYNGDYYSILHVSSKASGEKIKSAYRNLALKWHPDRNKGPDAEETFKRIQHAYEQLSDPIKKAQYDSERNFEKVAKEKSKYSATQEKPQAQKTHPVTKSETPTPKQTGWFSKKGVIIIGILIIIGSMSGDKNSSNNIPITNDNTTISSIPTTFPTSYPTIENIIPTIVPTIHIYTPTPSQYVEPTIDCTGPDGKHLFVTRKACDDFNNAWKPKPSPTSTNPCNNCPQNSHCSYSSCLCNEGYTKNYSNNQCEPCPENSHGSYGSCTCNDGYEKNYSTDKCVPCPSNSHGSYGSCTCNNGYQKNYSNNQCEPCPQNSHGSYGSCICDTGYTKNYSTDKCESQ